MKIDTSTAVPNGDIEHKTELYNGVTVNVRQSVIDELAAQGIDFMAEVQAAVDASLTDEEREFFAAQEADSVAEYLEENHGALGEDFDLDI